MSGLLALPAVLALAFVCWLEGNSLAFQAAGVAVALDIALTYFEYKQISDRGGWCAGRSRDGVKCVHESNLYGERPCKGMTPMADRGAAKKQRTAHWQRNAAPLPTHLDSEDLRQRIARGEA